MTTIMSRATTERTKESDLYSGQLPNIIALNAKTRRMTGRTTTLTLKITLKVKNYSPTAWTRPIIRHAVGHAIENSITKFNLSAQD